MTNDNPNGSGKTGPEADEELSAALEAAFAGIQRDGQARAAGEPPCAPPDCAPPVVSLASVGHSPLPAPAPDEQDDADDAEFQRFMEWVETSPQAKRRKRRKTHFLTTSQRYNIGVLGVGRMVDGVHALLAARFMKENEKEGPALLYSTREFEMQRYQSRGEKVSPLVLAVRGYRPNFLVIVQSAKRLADLPAAGIADLALSCCQAANPRHDIEPFHAAFVVRAKFTHFEEYRQRAAGQPWCAVGQFTLDQPGMDELEAVITRTATERFRAQP